MYLTIKDVTKMLQIKPATLYAWVAQGMIPHLKIGRLLRFDPDEFESWLQDHHREPIPEPHRRSHDADHIAALIARAKAEVYTPSHGTPEQDRAARKGEHRGTV